MANHGPHRYAMLGQIVRLFQMLAFTMSFNVWQDSGAALQLTQFSTVAGYVTKGIVTGGSFVVLFYIALVWVTTFVALFGYTVWCFFRNSFPFLWPLRLLRSMGALSASHLYIPLASVLLSCFSCGLGEAADAWTVAGYTCYEGAHLAQAIVATILLAFFIPLAALFTCLVIDAHPLSTSLAAKSHGRADLVFLVTKTALIVAVEVFPRTFGTWVAAGFVAAGAAVWVATYALLMPYTRHASNRLQLACACVNAWAATCLLVALASPGYNPSIAVYLGMPLAAAVGAFVARSRAEYLAATPVAALTCSYEVGLKARYALHAAVWGHPTKEVLPAMPTPPSAAAVTASRAMLESAADDGGDGTALLAAAGVAVSDRISALEALRSGSLDEAKRSTTVRSLVTRADLDDIAAIYTAGLARFSASPLLNGFAAQFYCVLRDNRHLEMQHLQAAERLEPFIDVSLFIAKARQRSADAGSHSINAIARVAFDKHLVIARTCVVAALEAQSKFWTALAEPLPDVTKLAGASVAMNSAIASAHEAFQQLMRIKAKSPVTLRLFADFQRLVLRNEARAAEFTAEADRIDDALARVDQGSSGDHEIFEKLDRDVPSDNSAVLVISADAGNLGIILSANAGASKLFGYMRSELEFRSVSMLMPAAIGRMHDTFMRRYMKSGDGEIVDYTRVVLGMHRSGAIFPMSLSVRESSAMEDASSGGTSFVGIMRAYAMESEVMLLDAHDSVVAASAASLALLGVTAAALAAPRHTVASGSTSKPFAPGGTTARSTTTATATGAAAEVPNHVSEWVREWGAELSALRDGAEVPLLIDPTSRAPTKSASTPRRAADGTAERLDDNGGVVSPSGSSRPTWVVARLKSYAVGAGVLRVSVLYWTRLADDATTVARAVARRRASLAGVRTADPVARETTPAVGDGAAGGCPFMGIGGDKPPASHASMRVSTPRIPHADTSVKPADCTYALPGMPLSALVRPRGRGAASTPSPSPGRRISFTPLPSRDDASDDTAAAATAEAASGLDDDAKLRDMLLPALPPAAKSEPWAKQSSSRRDLNLAPSPPADDSADTDGDDIGDDYLADGAGGGSRSMRDRDDKDGGASSSHKSANTNKANDRLRHIVLGGTVSILPALKTLRIVALCTVIGCAILAVATTVFESSVLLTFRTELNTALVAPDILNSFGATARLAGSLMLQSEGMWPLQSPADLALTRANLVTAGDQIGSLVASSFAAAQGYGDDKLYLTSSITFLDTTGAWTAVSLLKAAAMVQAAAYKVAELPLGSLASSPALYTVFDNLMPGAPTFAAINATSVEFFVGAVNNAQSARSIAFIVVLSASLAIVAAALVFLPFLASIERQRDSYITPFLTLPPSIVDKLRLGVDRRLARVRRALQDGDGGGGASDGDEDEDGTVTCDLEGDDNDEDGAGNGDVADWRALLQAAMIKTAGAHAVTAGAGTQRELCTTIAMATPVAEQDATARSAACSDMRRSSSPPPAGGGTSGSKSGAPPPPLRIRFPKRAHRKSGCSFAALVVRFAVPLLVLLLFFGVKYVITLQHIDAAVRSGTAAIVASFRASEVGETYLGVCSAVLTNGAPNASSVAAGLATATRLVDQCELHNDVLQFGVDALDPILASANNAMHATGVVPPSAQQAILDGMLGDGCTYLAGADPASRARELVLPYNDTACRAFGGGVIAHGLYGAFLLYIGTAKAYIAERASVVTDAYGSGIDAHGAPYSSVLVMRGSDFTAWQELAFTYVMPAFSDIAQRYRDAALAAVDDLRTFDTAWTAAFLVAFLAVFVTVYLPKTVSTSRHITDQRVMLVLLPPQIVDAVEDLAVAIRAELSREGADKGIQN